MVGHTMYRAASSGVLREEWKLNIYRNWDEEFQCLRRQAMVNYFQHILLCIKMLN